MADDYVHGINKMKKPSTKVMAPPGGKTNINLFGGAEEAPNHHVNKCQAHRNQSTIFGGAAEQKTAPVPVAPAPSVIPQAPQPAKPAEPSSAPTGPCAPSGGKPSSRVLAPPGGKSSNIFG